MIEVHARPNDLDKLSVAAATLRQSLLSGVRLREMMCAESGISGPKSLPPARYTAGFVTAGCWPK